MTEITARGVPPERGRGGTTASGGRGVGAGGVDGDSPAAVGVALRRSRNGVAGGLTGTVASACRPRGAATAPAATLGQPWSRAPSDREANMRGTTVAGASVPVGIVAGLWRYPVKSMAAEALPSASLSWAGVAGDRRW